MMLFGEKLREARKKAGLSQAKLAEAAGITTRSLQYYESGQRRPQTPQVVVSLAQALGVPVGALTDENLAYSSGPKRFAGGDAARRAQLNELLAVIAQVMSGGVEEEDARAFMCAVNDIYFNSRKNHGDAGGEYRVETYLGRS